ncbi:uncharacterized protein METZ01_LOCUS241173, partial [marine metagenome]
MFFHSRILYKNLNLFFLVILSAVIPMVVSAAPNDQTRWD